MLGFTALTGDLDTFAARNSRRKVFYSLPSGAATLTGLTSLADSEETDGPVFDWFEERFKEKVMTTVSFVAASAGPWQTSVGAGGATIAYIAGATARLKVSANETLNNWQVGERIQIVRVLTSTTDVRNNVFARITAIDIDNNVITIVIQDAITVDNTADTYDGNLIMSLGTPHAEGGSLPGSQSNTYPINPGNYCQIFKTVWGMSETAMNQPLFFDDEGGYRTLAMKAARKHLIEIENAVLFGQRTTTNVTMPDGSASVVRTMGGIKWFLQQFEAANGGTFLYRPGGAALTANTDDQKRIIVGPATGILPTSEWLSIEERMFRRTMSSTDEKLVIGGSGFIAAILKYYRASTVSNIHVNRGFTEEMKLSLNLHTIQTDYGTIHLKSHPRFNDQGYLRNAGYVLDMPNIIFRPMRGRDTHKKEHVENPGDDLRKDQILTEAGLEVREPESHMWFENVAEIDAP